jgi:hypothetical protein
MFQFTGLVSYTIAAAAVWWINETYVYVKVIKILFRKKLRAD